MKRKSQKHIIAGALLRLMLVNTLLATSTCACGLIDNLFIGQKMDSNALAAVGFFSPVTTAVGLSYVIILGAQILTGNLVGGGQTKKVNRLFLTSFTVLVIVFFVLAACCFIFRGELATILGADDQAFDYLCDYIKGYAPGILPQTLAALLMALCSFNNDLKLSYFSIGAMIVGNLAGDWLLIGNFGLFGIGLASTISSTAAFLVMLTGFFNKGKLFHFERGCGFDLKLVLQAARRGLPSLMLTDPHIIEYMQLLKSYGVYVHLWTNGTLLSEENEPKIAELCDMLTVSLDSANAEANDMSRGVKGATERAINGLRLLRQSSDKLFLRIHSVISALNIDHLDEIADLAHSIGVNEIGGALIAPFDFVPDYMRFSDEQIKTLNISIEALCEYAKTKGVALAGCYANVSAKVIQNLRHIHNMYKDNSAEVPGKHITCMGLWGQAQVRPNGDVSVCCFTYKPVLGNLHQNSFSEIWNSSRANGLRDIAKRGEYIDTPCVGCDTGHPVFTRELELTHSLESFYVMSINAR